MAKKISAYIKLQVPAGKANPSPPVGPALGQRTSSAQLTGNYAPEQLVGRQVVCVLNFPPRRVADVESQVLVLAALCPREGTVLLAPERPVEDGSRIA